jgi:hypothetical protein
VKPISRATADGVELYDAAAELIETVPLPGPLSGPVDDHAVAASLEHLAYVTATEVVSVDRTGRERWRFPLGPRPGNTRNCCAYSADDALVWVYAPGPDRLIALDAGTGEPRIRHDLPSTGQGGHLFATPAGQHMLLDVGEGRDGSLIFRTGPGEKLYEYPWPDRALVAVGPDGTRMMTVHHEQQDVAFHDVASGEVELRLPIGAFSYEPDDDVYIEWTGGYLDPDTAIVVLGGEDEDGDGEEWWRHFAVDLRTGEVRPFDVTTIDLYDLQPLGDGTYLVTDTDGTLRRL